jgi:tRNA threonylcarbamoyladenosine biosynthesis protein TsaE
MSVCEFLPDVAATERLGERLAKTRPESAVVFLRGDLGAGKSALARAMLRALGVAGPIKSPTYTLIERYPIANGEAVHLDLYRIAEAAELEFLGLDDFDGRARLWLVEWPERGGSSLPRPDLDVLLSVDGTGRRVELRASSPIGQGWLAESEQNRGS